MRLCQFSLIFNNLVKDFEKLSLAFLLALALPSINVPAYADDWGYSDISKEDSHPQGEDSKGAQSSIPVVELNAVPLSIVKKEKTLNKPQAVTKSAPTVHQHKSPNVKTEIAFVELPSKKNERAIAYWVDLINLISQTELSTEDKQKIRDEVKAVLDSDLPALQNKKKCILEIIDFYPALIVQVQDHPDLGLLYTDLLRALFRLVLNEAPGDLFLSETTVRMLLGPSRLAYSETNIQKPQLTEDAINAYSDMACFLYEQKNPDKTLDATDNRAIFAKVISNKFAQAPDFKARMSMAYFDISWAKFRLNWFFAKKPDERKALLAIFGSKQGTDPTKAIIVQSNHVLESVLSCHLWSPTTKKWSIK